MYDSMQHLIPTTNKINYELTDRKCKICLVTQLLHGHENEKDQRPFMAVHPLSTGRIKNANTLIILKLCV